MSKYSSNIIISLLIMCFVATASLSSNAAESRNEKIIDQYLSSIKHDPVQLRIFLQALPKGADLHTHLDGAIYAESYIRWAAEDGKCFNIETQTIVDACDPSNQKLIRAHKLLSDPTLFNKAVDAMSIRNYDKSNVSGHTQFFSTFSKFSGAIRGREGHMLAEIAQRAASQNVSLLELQVVFKIFEAAALADEFSGKEPPDQVHLALQHPKIKTLTEAAIKQLDEAESVKDKLLDCHVSPALPACEVKLLFLPTIIRVLPEGSIAPQAALAFSLVNSDERFVGINIAAPEDNALALKNYTNHMTMLGLFGKEYPNVSDRLSLHAGELKLGLVNTSDLTDNIFEAVTIAKAKRIGHGVSIAHELAKHPNLLILMQKSSTVVEINLTSNEVILELAYDDHPFRFYLDNHIPLVISTDDEGVSRIDLTHEFQLATQRYNLNYAELKSIIRNSLEYSFLSGRSLFTDYSSLTIELVCSGSLVDIQDSSNRCQQFLLSNEKARFQTQLEKDLLEFEMAIEVEFSPSQHQ